MQNLRRNQNLNNQGKSYLNIIFLKKTSRQTTAHGQAACFCKKRFLRTSEEQKKKKKNRKRARASIIGILHSEVLSKNFLY